MLQLNFTDTTIVEYYSYGTKIDCRKYFITIEVYYIIALYSSLDIVVRESTKGGDLCSNGN